MSLNEDQGAVDAITDEAAEPQPVQQDDAVTDVGQKQPQPTSKRQMKKLAKFEKRRLYMEEKKAAEKAARQAANAIKRQEIKERMSKLTEEELSAYRARREANITAKRAEREAHRAKLREAIESGQRLIIDLGFAEYMTETELGSICQQLSYAYSANQKAVNPVHLIFTGISGKMADVIKLKLQGLPKWLISTTEQPYEEHFADKKDELVYLTADSSEELQELDPSKMYIIGGIVDRNRHKGLCQRKAEKQGISTARLPIGGYVKLASSQVLCTNHVVEIIIKWKELHDWRAAFEAVIPTRKRKAEAEAKTEGSDGGDDQHHEEKQQQLEDKEGEGGES